MFVRLLCAFLGQASAVPVRALAGGKYVSSRSSPERSLSMYFSLPVVLRRSHTHSFLHP